jgi:IS30 family transposase
MLVKVAKEDTKSVITALIKSAQKLPRELYKSLTWDRGKELAGHPRFTLATDVGVYFCDPQSPLSADCFAIACRAVRGSVGQTRTSTGF